MWEPQYSKVVVTCCAGSGRGVAAHEVGRMRYNVSMAETRQKEMLRTLSCSAIEEWP